MQFPIFIMNIISWMIIFMTFGMPVAKGRGNLLFITKKLLNCLHVRISIWLYKKQFKL